MATNPTNNAIPSESPRDLKYNAGKIDEIVNSPDDAYRDRLGKSRLTWAGIEALSKLALANFGYITVESFEDGFTLTIPNQVLLYEANGNYYRWTGSFPKVVAAGSQPGDGWLSVADAALRSELAQPDGSSLLGYGTSTVSDFLDSLSSGAGAGLIGYKFPSSLINTQIVSQSLLNSHLVQIEYFYHDEDGNDWGLALQRAFDHYKNELSASISFGCREYHFSTNAAYDGAANITLSGMNGTVFTFLNTDTSQPSISIKTQRRATLGGFVVNAIQPSSSAKVCFYVNSTNQDASHLIYNIRAAADIQSGSGAVILFDIVNPSLSSFTDVYARYFGDTAPYIGSNNICWRFTAAGKISTDNMFRNCTIVGCEIAYQCTFPNGSGGSFLEGMSWFGCTCVNVGIGVYMVGDRNSSYKSPMHRWIGGHIAAYRYAFYANWVGSLTIDNTYFYCAYDTRYSNVGNPNYPIFLDSTLEARVDNTGLTFTGQPSATAGYEGVHVGPGCDLTIVRDVTYFNPIAAPVVRMFAGSRRARVGGCSALYSGTAPLSAVDSTTSTEYLDMGFNTVYPQ